MGARASGPAGTARALGRAGLRVLAGGLLGAVVLGSASPAEAAPRWRKHTTPRVAVVAPASPVPAPVMTPIVVPLTPEAGYEAEVLRLVNVERAAAGLPALSRSTCAAGFARTWSATLARTGAFEHQPLSPVMSGCGARGAGENIAYGNVTAAQMVAMWMGSSGHRANILRASFTHLGTGAVQTSTGRWYGTQVFLTL